MWIDEKLSKPELFGTSGFFFPKKCSLAGLSKYANQLFMLLFSVQILACICTSYTADFDFALSCISDTCEVCLGLPPCSAVSPTR